MRCTQINNVFDSLIFWKVPRVRPTEMAHQPLLDNRILDLYVLLYYSQDRQQITTTLRRRIEYSY